MLDHVIDKYTAQMGELLQHHISVDPHVLKTSEWYYGFLKAQIHKNAHLLKRKPRRYLEIACYRHILGYRLAKDFGFESTQFDICDRDLEIGRDLAIQEGYPDTVERVVGDFHSLPFSDNYFDFAFISASIHHTRQPDQIIREAMRVLTDGGLFYCQREPCERLFCFYQFNANRASLFTDFERKIHENDMMRVISSPYPGARNAELFGRVENDRIPLDMYYETFAEFGTVVEEVVYFDGLLTKIDRDILDNSKRTEKELASFIAERLTREMDEVQTAYAEQDRLLGYSLPNATDISQMSERVASALKARPKDEGSAEWNRAMAKIFGGSLRFTVRRDRKDGAKPSNKKYRRGVGDNGRSVLMDDAIYRDSGLRFWDHLLPDVSTADQEQLFDTSFNHDDWVYFAQSDNLPMMMAKSADVKLQPKLNEPAVVLVRYRFIVDEDLPWAKLKVTLNGETVEDVIVAQSEDRVLRLPVEPGAPEIRFTITSIDGGEIDGHGRLRIPIVQAIPVEPDVIAKQAGQAAVAE